MNAAKRLTLGLDDTGHRRRGRTTKDWSGPCSLTYDLSRDWPDVEVGDVISTEAGSDYLVLTVRLVNSTAVEPGTRRFALDCERISREAANDARLAGGRVYPMRWYTR